MSNKNPGPAPVGAIPEVPDEQPLPEVMESLPGDILKESSPFATPMPVKSADAIAQVTSKFQASLTKPDYRKDYLFTVKLGNQLLGHRIGALPLLPLLRRPTHAKTLLTPAMESIFQAAPTLWVESRTVLEGVDLDKAKANHARLLFVRQVIELTFNHLESLQALESHLEVELDEVAQTVYSRSESAANTNPSLGKMLKPLTTLVTHNAEQGADTKKKFAKRLRKDGAGQEEPVPPPVAEKPPVVERPAPEPKGEVAPLPPGMTRKR